jgi:hypothetical protein
MPVRREKLLVGLVNNGVHGPKPFKGAGDNIVQQPLPLLAHQAGLFIGIKRVQASVLVEY